MATKKNTLNTIIIIVVCLLLGSGGTYVYLRNSESTIKITNEFAKAIPIKGLYVFIKSRPIKKYQVLGDVHGEDLEEVIDSTGIGKEKAGRVFKNILGIGRRQQFIEKINVMIDRAKQQYNNNVQGIIFQDKLTVATAIKFNEQ